MEICETRYIVLESVISAGGPETITESGNYAKKVLVLVAPAAKMSENGRTYDESAVRAKVEELQARIDSGIQVLNFKSHPDLVATEHGAVFDYKQHEAISQITRIWYEPSGEVWSIAEFLPTEAGRKWARMAARLEKLAVSWRTDSDCTGTHGTGVCSPLDLDGWDWLIPGVERPGFSVAGLREVVESITEACKCGGTCGSCGNENLSGREAETPTNAASQENRETIMDFRGLAKALSSSELEWSAVKSALLSAGATEEAANEIEPVYAELVLEAKGKKMPPMKDKEEDKGSCEHKAPKNEALIPDPTVARLAAAFGNVGPERLALFSKVLEKFEAQEAKDDLQAFVEDLLSKPTFESVNISDGKLFPANEIKSLKDTVVKEATSKDEARGMVRMGLQAITHKVAAVNSVKGRPVVESVGEDRGYMEFVEKINKSADDYRRQYMPEQERIRNVVGKSNDKIAETLVNRFAAGKNDTLKRGAEYQRDRAKRESVVESTYLIDDSDMLNRDMVLTAITSQRFHQMMSGRLVNVPGPASVQLGQSVPNVGRFVSLQTETFIPADEGDPNFFLEPTDPRPEIGVQTTWQQHFARYMGLGYRIADQEMIFLARGPLNYDVVGRVAAQAGAALARQDDIRVHTEILTTSDEYRALVITNEVAQNAHTNYSSGGSVTMNGVTYGTNCYGAVWLRRGASTGASIEFGPVVRSRETYTNWDGNTTRTVRNPVNINDINSVEQVMGWLDSNLNIRNFRDSEPATFAVDWDRGVVLFRATADSGMDDSSNRPTFAQYSAVRNVTVFDLDLGSLTRGEKADELVTAIADLATEIRKYRFDYPDYALFPEIIGGKTVPHANAFEPLTRKEWAMLNTGFGPEIAIGAVSGVNLLKTETPLPGGDLRAVMSRMGHTVFLPIEPLRIEGPLPGAVSQSGTVRYTSERVWQLTEVNLLATPLILGQDGTKHNFPSTSFFFQNSPAGYSLGIS